MIGFAIVNATMVLVVALTKIFGDHCWAPRVGGLLVGFAVFAQGYAYANAESFTRRLPSGLTLEQRVLHVVYVSSVIGTFLWALGDFIPSMFGVAVCKH
ncbi:hypothetical protein [Lysobacter sp. HA35]